MKKINQLRILHHKNNVDTNSDLFQDLQSNNDHYINKIAALKNFQSQSKKKKKENIILQEYFDEVKRLNTMYGKASHAMNMQWQSILSCSPDCAYMLEENAHAESQLKQLKDTLSKQQRELRQMIKSSMKEASQQKEGDGLVASLLADTLMKFRVDHSKCFQSLREEEMRYRSEVNQADKIIKALLREDTLQEQDRSFRDELLQLIQKAFGNNDRIRTNQTTELNNEISVNENDSSPTNGELGSTTQRSQKGSNWIGFDEREMEELLDHEEVAETLHVFMQKISLLETEYQVFVAEIELSKENLARELGIAESGGAHGGWDSTEHDTFAKIYRKAMSTGMKRSDMLLLMTKQIPTRSREEILVHEEWHRKVKLLTSKLKERQANFEAARADTLHAAKDAVLGAIQERQQLEEHERQQKVFEAKREAAHQRLEQLRSERDDFYRAQQAEVSKQSLLLAQIQEEEQKLREALREKKKELIREFAQRREEERRRKEEERRAAEEEQEAKRKQMVEENKPRVAYRAQQVEEKNKQRQQQQKLMEEQEERRLAFLADLAKQVPYWEAIQEAKSRLDHVTASVKAHEFVASEEEITRGHLPLLGFTDNRVIRDTRFRLAEALRKAGVQHSAAAREIVQQFHPRPHLAIHGIL